MDELFFLLFKVKNLGPTTDGWQDLFLIAELYGLNPIDIYFEIGKFIQREKYDEQTIQQYETRLRESGFYDWAAEEE